ncbi:MAG: response regulator [Deltaproteobacteria bacterium]|nr:response regulator [Deltaproteobacteria bacterium]
MGRTILLADDSKTIRKAVEMALDGEDYDIVAVSRAADVVPKCKEIDLSAVLLDVNFNDKEDQRTGLDICRELKSEDSCRDIPVIFMHPLMGTFDEQAAFSAGGSGHVSKPFECRELLSALDEAISRPAQEKSSVAAAISETISDFAGSPAEPPAPAESEAISPEPEAVPTVPEQVEEDVEAIAPEPGVNEARPIAPEPIAPEPSLGDAQDKAATDFSSMPSPVDAQIPDTGEEGMGTSAEDLPEASIEDLPEASIEDLPEASIEDLPEASIEDLPEASIEDLPKEPIEDLSEAPIEDGGKLPEEEVSESTTPEPLQDEIEAAGNPPEAANAGEAGAATGTEDIGEDVFDFGLDGEPAQSGDNASEGLSSSADEAHEENPEESLSEEMPEPWKGADLSASDGALESVETEETPSVPDSSPVPSSLEPKPVVASDSRHVEPDGLEASKAGSDLERELGAIAYRIIERIAWEVVPDLAETLIREELDRLIREKKGSN